MINDLIISGADLLDLEEASVKSFETFKKDFKKLILAYKEQKKVISQKDEEIQRLKAVLRANKVDVSLFDAEASTRRVKVDHSWVKEKQDDQQAELKLDSD